MGEQLWILYCFPFKQLTIFLLGPLLKTQHCWYFLQSLLVNVHTNRQTAVKCMCIPWKTYTRAKDSYGSKIILYEICVQARWFSHSQLSQLWSLRTPGFPAVPPWRARAVQQIQEDVCWFRFCPIWTISGRSLRSKSHSVRFSMKSIKLVQTRKWEVSWAEDQKLTQKPLPQGKSVRQRHLTRFSISAERLFEFMRVTWMSDSESTIQPACLWSAVCLQSFTCFQATVQTVHQHWSSLEQSAVHP